MVVQECTFKPKLVAKPTQKTKQKIVLRYPLKQRQINSQLNSSEQTERHPSANYKICSVDRTREPTERKMISN
jgi:predicted fused transcriptional regulator/phosphomethylpyrimidine kinase